MTDPTPATPIAAPVVPAVAAAPAAPAPAPAPLADDPPTPAPAADPAPAAPPAGDPPPAAGDWPEDWRTKYSQDPAVLKRLERYASPKAAIDALFAAQTRISKGDLLPTLKENATPEDVAEYRTAHGIPLEATGYEINLPNGLVIGDADKPVVDEFLARAHAQNMHPSQVNDALGWYFDKQEQARVAQEARDTEHRMATEDELRAEFGPDYRLNVKLAHEILSSAPGDLSDKLLGGRLADGKLIGNDPDVVRWLTKLSRELNPVATVVPGSGTNAVQAVESEMASMKKLMGDRNSEYWKGPLAAKHQARYKQLVEAVQKGRV